MIQLRPAEPNDIPWLMTQLKAYSEFFGSKYSLYPTYEYGAQKLTELMDNHVVLVAYSDISDQPCVGFIVGLLTSHFFNPEIMTLTELIWWVEPDWRNTRAALMLFLEFVDIGKRHANWISMSLEEKSPVSPHALEKRGFKLYEHSFLLEV